MKKKSTVSLLDILLINRIIFPAPRLTIIFGEIPTNEFPPNEKVVFIQDETELTHFMAGIETSFTLINYASELSINPKAFDLLEGVIDLSKKSKSLYQKYFFINNPDGSIRWFFPKSNKTPCYLNLYNGSGWKANLFVKTSKFLSKIKGFSIISDGQFSVYQKNKKSFQTNFPKESFDEFAVFTGTIGENRKAIISLSKNGMVKQFIKIPLTKSSAKLVKNEFQQLSKLGRSIFETTVLPDVKYKGDQIMVTNIAPSLKNKNQNWSSIHWKSLKELYTNSYQKKSLNKTLFWNTINHGIQFLDGLYDCKNGLSEKSIQSLKRFVEQAIDQIDSTIPIPLGVGHGDFTPWNMYVGESKLHIYDWEMSQSDFPLLFDTFHYFFQKGILIQKKNYAGIWDEIQTALQSIEAQNLLAAFDVNIEKHFQLYLIYIVCYYLPKYISQPKLHDQVHWLVSTWIEAFQSIQGKVHGQIKL